MKLQKNLFSVMVLSLFVSLLMSSPARTIATDYEQPDVPIIDVELKIRFTEPASMRSTEIASPFTLQATNLEDIIMFQKVGDYDDVKFSTFVQQATTVTYSSSWSFTDAPAETLLSYASVDGNFQTLSAVDEDGLDYWNDKSDMQFRSWLQNKDVRELLTEAAQLYNNSWTWADLGQTTQFLVMTLDKDVVEPMLDRMVYRDDFETGDGAEMTAADMTDVAENIYNLAGGTTNTFLNVWNSTTATDPFAKVEGYFDEDNNISGLVELNNIHNALYGYIGYELYAEPTDLNVLGLPATNDRWSFRLNEEGDYEVSTTVDSTLENSTNHPIDNFLLQLTSSLPFISALVGLIAEPNTVFFVAGVAAILLIIVWAVVYLAFKPDTKKGDREFRMRWFAYCAIAFTLIVGYTILFTEAAWF